MDRQVKMTPKEFIEKWIGLLESGKYQQGESKLHVIEDGVESYCCLGVACELFKKTFGLRRYSKMDEMEEISCGAAKIFSYGKEGNDQYLPSEIKKFLSVDDDFEIPGCYVAVVARRKKIHGWDMIHSATLTELNDDGNWSFNDIAEVLREYLKGEYK